MAERWFNNSIEKTCKLLETDLEKGLNDGEVLTKKEKYGLNELKERKKEKFITKIFGTV